MSGHTPGPWKLRLIRWSKDAPVQGFAVLAEGRNHSVASANCYESTALEGEFSPDEIEANASRIVSCVNALEGFADPDAAPDLLEAAKRVLAAPFGTLGDNDELDAAFHALDAAVARAEGGSE